MPDVPALSIIVATYRREQLLTACLASLARARGSADFEVVVVDDGGGLLPSIAVAGEGLEVQYVSLERNVGQPGAQAEGVRRARGSLLAFLDDDAVVEPGWAEAILGCFARCGNVGAVLGRIDACDRSHILARMRQQIYERRHRTYLDRAHADALRARYALAVPAGLPLSAHVSGGNFAVRRSVLESVGGLACDVRLGCDDLLTERLLRAGHAIAYEPAMCIRHHHNRRFGVLFRNNFVEGRDRVRIARLDGQRRGAAVRAAAGNLARVPFSIREFPEMLDAGGSRVAIYLLYTAVQTFDAAGRMYESMTGRWS